MKPKAQKHKTNHSWLFKVLFISWLTVFGFGAALLILTGQLRGSPAISNWAGILMIIWLLAFVVRRRERKGLSTLPGLDLRSHANDVPESPPGRYRLSDDGEIVEIPEKPKKNSSRY